MPNPVQGPWYLLTPASVKLPKSFVAIDLSEKVPDAFERRTNGKGKEKEDSKSEDEERGRSEERMDGISVADENGNAALPALRKEISPTKLPPPALDV